MLDDQEAGKLEVLPYKEPGIIFPDNGIFISTEHRYGKMSLSIPWSFTLVLWWCLVSGCSSGDPRITEDEVAMNGVDTSVVVDIRIPVKVAPVRRGDFAVQLLTNGVVVAAQQVEIPVHLSARIEEVHVWDGLYVQKGELLCRQGDEELQLQLQRHQQELEQSQVKLNELLVAQGGVASDTSSVPPEMLRTLKITSGYQKTLHSIRETKHDLNQARIYAPFAGVLARVALQQHQHADPGEILCTLINPASYAVRFTVLEKDIASVAVGMPVEVELLAYPARNCRGMIRRIDPVIDDQGLLTVYARITSAKQGIYPGMKCQVVLQEMIKDQIIVPDEALVLRSNREVVFTLDSISSLAKWKYVKVGHRNNHGLTIAEGLGGDELVIVDGNLNLAHDAMVVVVGNERR